MKHTSILIIASTALLLLAACGGSGGGSASVTPPIPVIPPPSAGMIGDGRLDELVEWARASQGVPAMAAVIVIDDQVAEMSAVGQRTITGNETVAINDKWHIGSLTKAMTATLAGVLVDQSVITWDTRPIDIWPELDSTIHPLFRNATLQQFLSHTSGMRRGNDTPPQFGESGSGSATERRRNYAAAVLAEAPESTVGQFSYSNVGFVVAGAMQETITGTPYEILLQQQVFDPLGMLDSGFGAPGTQGQADQPWGHWDRGSGFEAVAPGPGADNPDTLAPAGTVHTTLADYGQFILAHLAGARGIAGLVTAPTFQTLQTPVHNGSALGWGVQSFETWAQGRALVHNGSNERWFAAVRIAPERNAGAMFVVNAGGGRANAAIDSLSDLMVERLDASQ